MEKEWQLSSKPGDETKKIELAGIKKQELRDRFDNDFALFTLQEEKYVIDSKEGEWEKAIVNSASTDGNRMIDLLAYSEEHLKIAITDEKLKKRDTLWKTEHAAIGLLRMADMVNEDLPEATTNRGTNSCYAIVRGWTVNRELIVEEDDDITPDLVAWDIRNNYWISGRRRLIWVCNIRYALNDEIYDEYPGWNNQHTTASSVEVGGLEYTPVYDIWKCVDPDKPAQNGVAINGEWVKEPQDVMVGIKKLFYLPIRIKPMRTLPLIMDGSNNDTIKHVGESFLLNNRTTLPLESRLLSYKLTRAGQLAKAPRVGTFDGSKSAGKAPDALDKDPFVGGRTLWLDSSKGQEIAQDFVPPNGTEIDSTYAQVINMRSTGSGLGPVAYGQPPYPPTAQGTDIINHNILDAIKPYQRGLENDRVWMAEEFIRQYKMGGFKEREFEGYDEKGKRFKTKVNPKKIDDNWRFECKLVLDLVRDENLHYGMAINAVKAGIASMQTMRDVHNIVKDPDGEQAIIDREMASKIGELALLDTAKALWDDGDDFDKLKAMQIFTKIMQGGQQAPPPGQGGAQGGGGRVMNPQATAGAMNNTGQVTVPGPVRDAAKRRK